MSECSGSLAVALFSTIVGGRTANPAPRQHSTGACPGPGTAKAVAAAAAVGEPRRAITTLMWLPLGTSPDHASPMLPSICSSRSLIAARYSPTVAGDAGSDCSRRSSSRGM